MKKRDYLTAVGTDKTGLSVAEQIDKAAMALSEKLETKGLELGDDDNDKNTNAKETPESNEK